MAIQMNQTSLPRGTLSCHFPPHFLLRLKINAKKKNQISTVLFKQCPGNDDFCNEKVKSNDVGH